MADQVDTIVAGTGPAGLLAALALARSGRTVAICGPAPQTEDRRTTALMAPALAFLDGLGLKEAVSAGAAPLQAMRIVDATARLIRSRPVTFHAREIEEEAFGLNIPNPVLNAALGEAVAAEPGVVWHRGQVCEWVTAEKEVHALLEDGTALAAPLAVGADGRASKAREAAGIRTYHRSYPQAALVLTFGHARDHGFVSTEFHTETGPFTQIPLPGRRSSLVWAVAPRTAEELAALDDAALALRIEERMQSFLGRVTVEPGRQVYPLSALVPARFAARRIALVGEAAHVFPPIGAQGLNLGVRDVQDLARVVSEEPGDIGGHAALARYDRLRRPDILARSGAVNLLNMSLLSDMLPAQLARSAGLGALATFRPLRTFFMREGMQPGSGFARAFSAFGEKVRRQQA